MATVSPYFGVDQLRRTGFEDSQPSAVLNAAHSRLFALSADGTALFLPGQVCLSDLIKEVDVRDLSISYNHEITGHATGEFVEGHVSNDRRASVLGHREVGVAFLGHYIRSE